LICALNKWSVQECAQTSFFPVTRQVFASFGMRTVQADSCLNSEQNDTLLISEGGHFGPEAQKMHVGVRTFF